MPFAVMSLMRRKELLSRCLAVVKRGKALFCLKPAYVGLLMLKGFLGVGCTEHPTPKEAPQDEDRSHQRYIRIRSLLEQAPGSEQRAFELQKLVRPLCTQAEAQAQFLETAQWSVSFSTDAYYLPTRLALEVIDYVMTVCGRIPNGIEWLEQAHPILDGDPRYHQLWAKAWALQKRFDKAASQALKAAELGEPQAIALAAYFRAQHARAVATEGYIEGMFGEALSITTAKPTARWPAVALAAVLSTRARLLLERAFWRSLAAEKNDRLEATHTLKRIVAGPFPTTVRMRASDLLCLEGYTLNALARPCSSAAGFGHRTANWIATSSSSPDRHPFPALNKRWQQLHPRDWVLVVFRGPVSELMEWTTAAERMFRQFGRLGVRLAVINRSLEPWSSGLIQNILTRADVVPSLVVDEHHREPSSSTAVACVAALLAKREKPVDCPLTEEQRQGFLDLPPMAFALAIGRDLDADISDLLLYDHPVVLASIRRSEMVEKGLLAWLKSVSDVLALVP